MIQLDLELNTIDVETLAPYFLGSRRAAQQARRAGSQAGNHGGPLVRRHRLRRAVLRLRPVPARPPRPARKVLLPGTLAYWRFDAGGADGSAFTGGQVVRDSSGHGMT